MQSFPDLSRVFLHVCLWNCHISILLKKRIIFVHLIHKPWFAWLIAATLAQNHLRRACFHRPFETQLDSISYTDFYWHVLQQAGTFLDLGGDRSNI